MTRATYRQAGVDIEAGDALVEMIKPLARATDRPGVVGGLGGFGALFDLRAAGFDDPILVSATDGVGTKLKLAIDSGIHHTIGIDLVAMCVNDLVVQGAQPLFFLDYFATGKLDLAIAQTVIAGVAEGCKRVGCALIGGETAEMPGMYRPGDYDLAGFAVGAAERGALLPRDVSPGDIVLGLASSGLHSNGFSLLRQIIVKADINLADPAPFSNGEMLAKALLTPTELYVGPVLGLARAGLLQAAAHITGGGLPGNLPRILPEGCAAELDSPWPMPASLRWLQTIGGIAAEEMLRVFNCGVGMVLVVRDAASAETLLRDAGHSPFRMGRIIATDGQPHISIPAAHFLFE